MTQRDTLHHSMRQLRQLPITNETRTLWERNVSALVALTPPPAPLTDAERYARALDRMR